MIRKFDRTPDKLGRVRLRVPGTPYPVFTRPAGIIRNPATSRYDEMFVGVGERQSILCERGDDGNVVFAREYKTLPVYVVPAGAPLAKANEKRRDLAPQVAA